jgi:beta-glucosidase
VEIKNTGKMNSDEVVQVYVGFPDSKVSRPIKALKAFKRANIPAGERVTVTLPLKADDLKYWNETQHAFVLEKGKVHLSIGASSDDIRLTGVLSAK